MRVLKLSWEGTNRDDLDFQLAFMSPDVEARFYGAPGIGLRDVYRGHDGVREMTHDWKLDIPDIRFEVLSLEDRGNLLLARVFASGHGATSGVEISNDAGLAYWFAGDGLIHRIDVYWKWEDAVEALGA